MKKEKTYSTEYLLNSYKLFFFINPLLPQQYYYLLPLFLSWKNSNSEEFLRVSIISFAKAVGIFSCQGEMNDKYFHSLPHKYIEKFKSNKSISFYPKGRWWSLRWLWHCFRWRLNFRHQEVWHDLLKPGLEGPLLEKGPEASLLNQDDPHSY